MSLKNVFAMDKPIAYKIQSVIYCCLKAKKMSALNNGKERAECAAKKHKNVVVSLTLKPDYFCTTNKFQCAEPNFIEINYYC